MVCVCVCTYVCVFVCAYESVCGHVCLWRACMHVAMYVRVCFINLCLCIDLYYCTLYMCVYVLGLTLEQLLQP